MAGHTFPLGLGGVTSAFRARHESGQPGVLFNAREGFLKGQRHLYRFRVPKYVGHPVNKGEKIIKARRRLALRGKNLALTQSLVSDIDIFEAFFCLWISRISVRMKLTGQTAVSRLDLFGRCPRVNP